MRLAVAVLAGLLVAGCGGTEPSTPDGGTEGGARVGMKGIQFNPSRVIVGTGQAVEWENLEDVPHNVVARSGAHFRSAVLRRGGRFSYTAEKPGTIRYVCTLHPGMDGTITVTG